MEYFKAEVPRTNTHVDGELRAVSESFICLDDSKSSPPVIKGFQVCDKVSPGWSGAEIEGTIVARA